MGPSDKFYSSSLVKDEVIGKGTATEFVLNWTPVKLATFSIKCGDTTYLSDKFGNLHDGTEDVKGNVTPAGTIKLGAAMGEDADEVTVTYRFDNESVREDGHEQAGFGSHPAAELQIKSVPVNAETRTMRAYWAFDAEYELSKEYGQDLEALLGTQIAGELAHEHTRANVE